MQKLYVLVDSCLSKSQQAVQASHAVAEYCLSKNDWKNDTLVILKTNEIERYIDKADAVWKEAYWDRITAVAYLGSDLFPELKLI